MNLKEWRKGLDIALDNVKLLIKDGEILLKKGSYGHAFFLFATAFEEIAVVFFIMDRYDDPQPQELSKEKFLNHFKKNAYTRNRIKSNLLFSREINLCKKS